MYYVQKSYRTDSGKSSPKTDERLGSIEELKARFGSEDPIGATKEYVKELSRSGKDLRREVIVRFSQDMLLKKGEQNNYNGGYLFLQKVYHDLGLHTICEKISKNIRMSTILTRFSQ